MAQRFSVFLICIAIGEALTSWAKIDIFVRFVDEILLAEAVAFAPEVMGLGKVTVISAS